MATISAQWFKTNENVGLAEKFDGLNICYEHRSTVPPRARKQRIRSEANDENIVIVDEGLL